jgi:hypothetical protein
MFKNINKIDTVCSTKRGLDSSGSFLLVSVPYLFTQEKVVLSVSFQHSWNHTIPAPPESVEEESEGEFARGPS